MRLCFLADADSIHTRKWVNSFTHDGREVRLISRTPYTPQPVPLGIDFEHVTGTPGPVPGLALLSTIIKYWFAVRRAQPEIVHAHRADAYGVYGALTGRHPFVLTAWGSDILITPKKSRWRKWLVQHALKKADLITCDADHLRDRMVELGADRQKIHLILFGVDAELFHPRRRDPHWKSRYGWSPMDPVIISLRSLLPIYDVESLVRAAPLVLQQVANARFFVTGNGALRPGLEELAHTLGVSAHVHFAGMLPYADLPICLASADVYVSTSLSDAGLASSTAEAMASELPVVVTDFGDNRQWVHEDQGGFLVPLQDPQMLAEKIVRLLNDAPFRKRCGSYNRALIAERNCLQKEMRKMDFLYDKLYKEHYS